MVDASPTVPDTAEHSRALWAQLLLLAVCVLAVLPVGLVTHVPANDYPFHAARLQILSNLDDPVFSRFYELGHLLLPNVAMDLVGVAIAQLTGAETASRIFVALCLIAMMSGTAFLHRAAHGVWSVWPLLAGSLLHNGIFYFGFFNYLFGAGLALSAAALWLILRPGPLRLVAAFLCGLVLMLCHMSAFGVFALIVGGIELCRAGAELRSGWQWRTILGLFASATPFVLLLLVFFLLSPTAGEADNALRYPGYWARPLHGALFALGTTHAGLDLVTAAVVGLLIAWSLYSMGLRSNGPVLLAALLLLVAVAVIPAEILGSDYADIRLVPIFAMTAIAAVEFRRPTMRGLAPFIVVVSALSVGRALYQAQVWNGYDEVIAEVTDSFAAMPEGAVLLAATTEAFPTQILAKPGMRERWHPSLKHIGSYAAFSPCRCFVPMTFADPTKQPLAIRTAYLPVKAFQVNGPKPVPDSDTLQALLHRIDAHRRNGDWPDIPDLYLLVVGWDALGEPNLEPDIVISGRGARHVLLRLPPASQS